jgi:hypothetical protein
MTGDEIINLLEQVKNQTYTYNELVNEGIEVELSGHRYIVCEIDEPKGNKAFGYGKDENGVDYDLLFYSKRDYNCVFYSLVEATAADLA